MKQMKRSTNKQNNEHKQQSSCGKNQTRSEDNNKIEKTVFNNTEENIKNRRKILTLIEEACAKGERARCYELIMEYSLSEPFVDHYEMKNTNYDVFMISLGPVLRMITSEYTLEQIRSYMRMMTNLYERDFSVYEEFIVYLTNDKKSALRTADLALSLLQITKNEIFGCFFDRNLLTREIVIHPHSKHKPKWMDDVGVPWLEEWLLHPEEWK